MKQTLPDSVQPMAWHRYGKGDHGAGWLGLPRPGARLVYQKDRQVLCRAASQGRTLAVGGGAEPGPAVPAGRARPGHPADERARPSAHVGRFPEGLRNAGYHADPSAATTIRRERSTRNGSCGPSKKCCSSSGGGQVRWNQNKGSLTRSNDTTPGACIQHAAAGHHVRSSNHSTVTSLSWWPFDKWGALQSATYAKGGSRRHRQLSHTSRRVSVPAHSRRLLSATLRRRSADRLEDKAP